MRAVGCQRLEVIDWKVVTFRIAAVVLPVLGGPTTAACNLGPVSTKNAIDRSEEASDMSISTLKCEGSAEHIKRVCIMEIPRRW